MQILASPCPPFLARNTILASALTAKEKPPAGCQKVPSSRHVRMDGTHTEKLSAESVRGRKAECTVQRSILSPGTAKLRRVQRTKQPKHNESEALPAAETAELELGQLSKFTSALRRAMEIWLTATKGAAVCLLQARCDGRSKSREPQPPRGRNFCPAYAGRNGFPLERVVFRHEARLQILSLFCLRGWNFRHVRPG